MHQPSQAQATDQQPRLLTVRDVAEVLQLSPACVYAMVAEGKLVVHRVGTGRGSIRVNRRDLDDYLDSCREQSQRSRPRPPRPRLKHLKL